MTCPDVFFFPTVCGMRTIARRQVECGKERNEQFALIGIRLRRQILQFFAQASKLGVVLHSRCFHHALKMRCDLRHQHIQALFHRDIELFARLPRQCHLFLGRELRRVHEFSVLCRCVSMSVREGGRKDVKKRKTKLSALWNCDEISSLTVT